MNIHISNYLNKKVHFIGVGGISMSGLAEILIKKGCSVTGSDINDSQIIKKLQSKGAVVNIGHKADYVKGADLVVYTAAISQDNPEYKYTQENHIPMMDRATLLGQIMQTFKFPIGISGSHGKTTTTSMLSVILMHAGVDPTILVGGEVDQIGGNVRTGSSDIFITEACEYVESFLKFFPYIAVILNIDRDHLDYFKDIDHIYNAFSKYSELVPNDGYVIGCADDKLTAKLMSETSKNTLGFGINNKTDLYAQDIEFDALGCAEFTVIYKDSNLGRVKINVPGKHNIYNSLASIISALCLGIDFESIKKGLSYFKGTHRRFEKKGQYNNITVIDDYAHHPREISATAQSLTNYPHNKVFCVFQPHTYTRTKLLFNDFIEALSGMDNLILTDIYAAREKDTGEIHSRDLAEAINKNNKNCLYISDFNDIVNYLKKNAQPGDVILTMGAGNVYRAGEMFLENSLKLSEATIC